MAEPAISIIVPIYRAEAYLRECVDSILGQTMQDFELILVDDCSPDRSYALCQELWADLPQVTLLRHARNEGPAAARNFGMCYARGKYVTFIDADDFVQPEFLAQLYAKAEQRQADVAAMGYTEYIREEGGDGFRPGQALRTIEQPALLIPDRKKRLHAMAQKKLICNAWGKLYLRKFLLENQIWFERIMSEDTIFHFLALCYAGTYAMLPYASYNYRQTDASITRGKGNPQKAAEALRSTVEMLRILDGYFERMDDVREDRDLIWEVKHFFCFAFFHIIVRNSCSGFFFKEIREDLLHALEGLFPGKGFFVEYLLEYYLANTNKAAGSAPAKKGS